MQQDGYRLYVEKESSSLEMLENGTELFRHLYALMQQQQPDDHMAFLIDSVEAGIKLIAHSWTAERRLCICYVLHVYSIIMLS